MDCSKCGVGEIDYSGRCGDCGYVYKLTNTGRKDDIGFKKLIDDHWSYVEFLLVAHNEQKSAIKYCEAAYKLGMELGLKQDSEMYEKIKNMFPFSGVLGNSYTKILVHFETSYEHGVKHAKEACEQS